MTVKSICFVAVALFLTLNFAEALHCYGCITSTSSDCYNGVIDSYFHQECTANGIKGFSGMDPITVDNKAIAIKKVCVQVTLADSTPNIFERGCGYIYENVDICDYMKLLYNVTYCSHCESDFCNYGTVKIA